MTDNVIRTEALRRTFDGDVALEGLDIELYRGEVLALLGHNGAGKTTTVRLLNGILAPDSGRATVLGVDPVTDGEVVRSRTGVMTENAGLDDRLTAIENLMFTARIRGLDRNAAERRADELIGRFGMAARRDHRTGGFSTGQRKRLALARALLHDPDILFLDEPTSGLDPAATRDVVELIGSLAAERGRTVVLCTHFLGEAQRIADRLAVIDRGRLHAIGTPSQLAHQLWDGVNVEIELDRAADEALVTRVAAEPGVLTAATAINGISIRVADRAVVPRVVEAVVAAGRSLFRVDPKDPSVEDIYFAIQDRIEETAA